MRAAHLIIEISPSGADVCDYEAEMPIVASSTGEVISPTIVRIHANIAITSEACFLAA